jgi:hypothetical protein
MLNQSQLLDPINLLETNLFFLIPFETNHQSLIQRMDQGISSQTLYLENYLFYPIHPNSSLFIRALSTVYYRKFHFTNCTGRKSQKTLCLAN